MWLYKLGYQLTYYISIANKNPCPFYFNKQNNKRRWFPSNHSLLPLSYHLLWLAGCYQNEFKIMIFCISVKHSLHKKKFLVELMSYLILYAFTNYRCWWIERMLFYVFITCTKQYIIQLNRDEWCAAVVHSGSVVVRNYMLLHLKIFRNRRPLVRAFRQEKK